MIYITGDTHIPMDIRKLLPQNFVRGEMLDDNDYVIITGDFGGVWYGDERDSEWLDFLETRKYNILFVDGNHENFDVLNRYDTVLWNGGKVHRIRSNVFHLMRGQVFTIDGSVFFTFGGGYSKDKATREEHVSWWKEEMPDDDEYAEGMKNLRDNGYIVDYIITHTAPLKVVSRFYFPAGEGKLNMYLSEIDKTVSYKKWYFGHVHADVQVDECHTALYNKIIELGE